MSSSSDTTVDQCDETMRFFQYAHDPRNSFRGTIKFRLENQGDLIIRTVRVSSDSSRTISVFDGDPPDKSVDCSVSMPSSVFLDVYSGEKHPLPLIMNGTIRVHNWGHRLLKNFCTAFDFSTENWDAFYEYESRRLSANLEEKSTFPEETDPAMAHPNLPPAYWWRTRFGMASLALWSHAAQPCFPAECGGGEQISRSLAKNRPPFEMLTLFRPLHSFWRSPRPHTLLRAVPGIRKALLLA
eukprot:474769_1